MELFTASLTGFFLWLLTFHWMIAARGRAREVAGTLVLEVRNGAPVRAERWMCLVVGVILFAMSVAFSHVVRFESLAGLGVVYCMVAVIVCMVLWTACALCRRDISLEVRECGLLLAGIWFVAWADVLDCRWLRTGKLRIRSRRRTRKRALALDQTDELTAALGRFVPVYDAKGALLAKPGEDQQTAEDAPRRSSHRYLLQFDLRSLLLMTVLVACAASCFGIGYRQLKPRWDAAARLRALGPKLSLIGTGEWAVDFSGCRIKPTDDDLVHLGQVEGLRILDLSGAPITNAGLAHLMKVKRLNAVFLDDTQVTAEGAAELSRALPEAVIFFRRKGGSAQTFGPSRRPGTTGGGHQQ